jgi:ABC-type antimicrobial peptide transport system permease subunit
VTGDVRGESLDDTQGDQMMWQILLVMLIVIMAFVFVVLTDATIESESAVIGTLLASGWRKRELIAHYLTLPLVVGVAGAIVGNVVGYTLLVVPMQSLYYNSYSFPPKWNVVGPSEVQQFDIVYGPYSARYGGNSMGGIVSVTTREPT